MNDRLVLSWLRLGIAEDEKKKKEISKKDQGRFFMLAEILPFVRTIAFALK